MRHGIHFFVLWFPICIFRVTVEKSDFHQISAVVPNILLLYKRMSFCTEETNWHLKREFYFRWQGAYTEADETTPKDKKGTVCLRCLTQICPIVKDHTWGIWVNWQKNRYTAKILVGGHRRVYFVVEGCSWGKTRWLIHQTFIFFVSFLDSLVHVR